MTYKTYLERAVFWTFRLATYLVLAAAAVIFLDIGIKGGRTVFTSKPPFINLPFLTEAPQTLYVFEFEGKKTGWAIANFGNGKQCIRASNRRLPAWRIPPAASGRASSERRSWSSAP